MSLASSFVDTVTSGPVLLAAPVAVAAGLVSFFSPCVLPLVPGYLSYVTGLSGAELQQAGSPATPSGSVLVRERPSELASAQRRVLLGSVLFVLGFSAVFTAYGALFGGLGRTLSEHQDGLQRVLGVLTIGLGLLFAGAFARLPLANREWRLLDRLPDRAGLAAAPLLGVLFGLGWTPCIGPTLGAVQGLAATSATAGRGALLSFLYCLGLGLPFLAAGLSLPRALGAFASMRKHLRTVSVVGGVLLVALGVLQVTGLWQDAVLWLQTSVAPTTLPV